MVTRKLDPGAIVLGTAIPLMRAEVRAVKRERAVARMGWERMVDDCVGIAWKGCTGINYSRHSWQNAGSRALGRKSRALILKTEGVYLSIDLKSIRIIGLDHWYAHLN